MTIMIPIWEVCEAIDKHTFDERFAFVQLLIEKYGEEEE